MKKSRIAIIGAGLAGLTVAKQLAHHAVSVFEKSRGVGGRLAMRRAGNISFDHGAQFFIAKTKAFRNFLQPFIAQQTLQPWQISFAEIQGNQVSQVRNWRDHPPHYVGTPHMSAFCQQLAKAMQIHLETKIITITSTHQTTPQWLLTDANNQQYGPFDWVITSVPVAQARQLLPQSFAHAHILQNYHMKSCYSLLLSFQQALTLPWQAACVKNNKISWISVNSSKPQRTDDCSLVVLASNQWADQHIEADSSWVARELRQSLVEIINDDLNGVIHQQLHRWRYANSDKQSGSAAWVDKQNKLAACGDWCIQGRVESAFLSATQLTSELALD